MWADILTLWAALDYDHFPARRIGAIKVPPFMKDKLELPSFNVISESQSKYHPSKTGEYTLSTEDNPLWFDKHGWLTSLQKTNNSSSV